MRLMLETSNTQGIFTSLWLDTMIDFELRRELLLRIFRILVNIFRTYFRIDFHHVQQEVYQPLQKAEYSKRDGQAWKIRSCPWNDCIGLVWSVVPRMGLTPG